MKERLPASTGRRGFLAAVGGATLASRRLAGPPDSGAWARLRSDLLLDPGVIYLNCGALGPTPRAVLDRVTEASRILETSPSVQGYGPLVWAMEDVRTQAAAFVGCATDELAITESTTTGMNAVALGIELRAGDRVLTTDQEHEGGRACWRYLARKRGIAVDTVPLPPELREPGAIVEQFAARLNDRTRVLSFSHVTFATGIRLPVRELASLARARDCLCVVDGAQAVGAISVDLSAIGCDAYAASGHKWLLGPKGTGLLYVRADRERPIDPLLLEGGPAAYTGATGVRNAPGIVGLGAAIASLAAVGMAAVESRVLELRNRLYGALRSQFRLRVLSPPPGPLASPLLAFELPDGFEDGPFASRLQERYGISVRPLSPLIPRGIRVSTHVFNSETDVDRLVEALGREV
jgi:selenocysteine lyase/cysteine desulfurase